MHPCGGATPGGKRLGHRSADSLPQPEHPPVSAETAKDRCPVRPFDPVVGAVGRHEWTGLDMTATYPPTESQGYHNRLLLTASRLAGRSSRCAVEMTWGSYPRPMPDTYRLAQISENSSKMSSYAVGGPPSAEACSAVVVPRSTRGCARSEKILSELGLWATSAAWLIQHQRRESENKSERSRDLPLSACQASAMNIKRLNSGMKRPIYDSERVRASLKLRILASRVG